MLKRYIVEFDNELKYAYAYALYGCLIERLSVETIELLHSNTLMLSQYVSKNKWIVTLFDNCPNEVDEILNSLKDYNLTKFDINLVVKDIVREDLVTEDDLLSKYLIKNEDNNRIVKIYFKSPTSFKSNDEYVLFPTKELILNSIIKKYNQIAVSSTIDDEKTIETMLNYTKIVGYNLKSYTYYMKTAKITGFIGNVTIKLNGSESLVRLQKLLFKFASYSGIGIKNTLGMGGIEIE